jgi:hypothetical protein
VSRSRYYDQVVRTAPECIHEMPGGDIVRPWCNTPACALCRRRHPVHWRQLGADATPKPKNVIPIRGTRALW